MAFVNVHPPSRHGATVIVDGFPVACTAFPGESPESDAAYTNANASELLEVGKTRLATRCVADVVHRLPTIDDNGRVGPTPAFIVGVLESGEHTLEPGFARGLAKTPDGLLFMFHVTDNPDFVKACFAFQ
jgi:hypothetical protein